MLRLLLDAHISPQIAAEVQRHQPECSIVSVHTWEDGVLARASDEAILDAAQAHGLTLVTRDLRTIPRLLQARATQGLAHAGVVFIDGRTIPDGNVGALVRELMRMWVEERHANWENRVDFLARSP